MFRVTVRRCSKIEAAASVQQAVTQKAQSFAPSHHVVHCSASVMEVVDSGIPGRPQRIYKSLYPSILDELDKHHSLCHYMFSQWATADPMGLAVLQAETNQHFTYPELTEMTHKVAGILYHCYAVRKGDVVCIAIPNSVVYAPLVYGVMELGAVVTTANSITTAEVLSPQVETSSAKVLIMLRKANVIADKTSSLVKGQTGKEVKVLYVEDIYAMDIMPLPSSYTAMQEAKSDDAVFLAYSSGTTGSPKGVQLTNKSITANILQRRSFGPQRNETFLAVLPFFHIYGFVTVMSASLAMCASQVIMMSFDADCYIENLEKYKINGASIAPPMVHALLHRLEAPGGRKVDLSSFLFCCCAAAPLSNDVAARFKALAPNMHLGQGWDMTEMSPSVVLKDGLYRFIMKRMPCHKRLHGGVRIVESIPRNAAGKLMRRQTHRAEVEYLEQLKTWCKE